MASKQFEDCVLFRVYGLFRSQQGEVLQTLGQTFDSLDAAKVEAERLNSFDVYPLLGARIECYKLEGSIKFGNIDGADTK